MTPHAYDVVVVGGGNAGLVAAISARHQAESVLLLERAPTWRRGGNSRHTRDIRYAHGPAEPFTTGEAYPEEELLDDLLRVGGGQDRALARLVVDQSCTGEKAEKGRAHRRRSEGLSRGGARCARAEVRWRDCHASGLDPVRHRGEQIRQALLRRGPGLLAQALRHLGAAHRGAARP